MAVVSPSAEIVNLKLERARFLGPAHHAFA
jgi:hypothetical protein